MKKDDVVIFSYTRAQAIADGVLIDVSEQAKQAGFCFPVAVTAGVWAECVAVPEGAAGQNETGRLSVVLSLLRFAIARKKGDGQRVDFAVHVRNDNREGDPPLVPALCPLRAGGRRGAGRNRDASLGGLRPWEATQRKTYAANLCGNLMRSRKGEPRLNSSTVRCGTPTNCARDFEVKGFAAPLVVVRRRSDAVLGTLFFQHEPRFYFGFSPD